MHPIDVQIDDEAGAGYITYAKGEVAETVEVWEQGAVAADVDSRGNILGIEVLGFDEELLSRARAFASENELIFPARLGSPV
jgi:uncharacterized protein YuzE